MLNIYRLNNVNFFAVLLAGDGANLKTFKEDPIKYASYILGVDTRADARDIAKKVLDQYFDSTKSYDDQLKEMQQVIYIVA